MANFLRNAALYVSAAIMSSALAAQSGPSGPSSPSGTDELLLDSGSVVLDRKTNLFNMQHPRITQGKLSVEADDATATAIDFEAASEFRLKGHVKVVADTATLTADEAVFTFANKRLSRGELRGGATFVDSRAAGMPIRGGAGELVYDYSTRTLRLSKGAWVHKDQYEIQGCDLIYDLNEERVTSGSADCAEPFRIRVLPQDGKGEAGGAAGSP